jgi:type I restriction enzyme S subunit
MYLNRNEYFLSFDDGKKQSNLRKDQILSCPVPIPSILEQHRIVAKIESLFKLADEIDSRRISLVEKVKALKATILQEAIQGKLVPQDKNDEDAGILLEKIKAEKEKLIKEGKIKKDKPLPEIKPEEIPFEIPKSWRWVRLGEITEYIQRGKSPKYDDQSEQLVISQKCIRWDFIDYSVAKTIDPKTINRYEEIRFLRNGDILWNSTGTGTLGRACLFNDYDRFSRLVVDSHVTVVRVINTSPKYIHSLIKSDWIQNNLKTSGSTNQIELNTTSINNQLVPLPPLSEQRQIVAKIEELFKSIDQMTEKVI